MSASAATEATDDSFFERGEQVAIDSESNAEQIQANIEGIYQDGYVVYADGGNWDFLENVDVMSLRPQDAMRRTAARAGFTVLRAKDPLSARPNSALH